MTYYITQSRAAAISRLAITTSPDPADDIWRDIYRASVSEVALGDIIKVHLVKQIELPSDYPGGNVAFLRRFELRTPEGIVLLTPNLGLNITRDSHYESSAESAIWVSDRVFPTGGLICYHARARSYSEKGYLNIFPTKGCLTVEQFRP